MQSVFPYLRVAFAALFAVAIFAATPSRVSMVVRPDNHSGRLVRTVVVKATAEQPTGQAVADTDSGLTDLVDSIAEENQVEAPLVHSVIRAESNYNPYAISPKGAQGIMQLIPSTAKRFGVMNSFNAKQNIEGGVKYLRHLLDLYGGNYPMAIAAYNAGEGAVARYGGIPPYAETRNYVDHVAKHLRNARQSAARKVQPKLVKADAPRDFNPIQASLASDGKIYYKTSQTP